MGKLHVKAGVDFGKALGAGGARILAALKSLVPAYGFDLTITSARDGVHSGPEDPHYAGNALDIRSNDLNPAQKALVLADLQSALYRSPRRFYCFLEHPGQPGEHFHCQTRNGTTYSVEDDIADL